MNDDTIIQLSHVKATYGQLTALDDVSITVGSHDFLGITGPNGGGKTTLLKVMLGLKKPDEGTVDYYRDGQPVDSINIGYLPQAASIDRHFPISVSEVVLSGLNARKNLFSPFTRHHWQQVEKTLHRLGIAHLAQRHIGALSGGQLQRVLLARAIVSEPEAVVLDEPDTYIDRPFREQMFQLLQQVNRNCAVVVVSHDLEAIRKYAGKTVSIGCQEPTYNL